MGIVFDQSLNTTDSPSFVDGNFSDTVTSNNFSGDGTGNVFLRQPSVGNPIWISHGGAVSYAFYNTTLRPIAGETIELGLGTNRWEKVWSAKGSFSNTLISEVGGSIRHYSTGTEGDTDTSFIEMGDDGTRHTIYTTQTGAGAFRNLRIGNTAHYMEVIPTSTKIDWYISGVKKFTVASTAVQFKDNLLPISGLVPSVGSDSLRWLGVYAQDGSFTGTLDTEVGGSNRIFNLGSDADVAAGDTEFGTTEFSSDVLRFGTKTTGSGVARDVGLIRNGAYKLYIGSSEATIYQQLVPFADASYSLGKVGRAWSNVYSVDGDFSGTVTANTITSSGANLTLQRNSLDAIAIGGTFIQCYHEIRPSITSIYSSGTETLRWSNTYSVDGSFSGNLISEVGGSLKMFSLGTEGDTDTETLTIDYDSGASKWEISTGQTGAGILRQLWFDASQFRMYESGTLLWIGESNELRMYGTIVPSSDGIRSVGSASKRFGGYYGVDGDFSGTITNTATTSWSATFDRAIRVGADSGVNWFYSSGNNSKFSTPVTFESSFQFARAADGINSRLYRYSKDASVFACRPVDSGVTGATIFQVEDATDTFQPLRTGGIVHHYPDNSGAQSYRMYNLGESGDADTEYLELSWSGNIAKIQALQTGTGTQRRLDIEASGIRLVESGTVIADVDAGALRLYTGSIRPLTDGVASAGTSSIRFSDVFSIDGSFSGNLDTEVGGSMRLFNLGSDADVAAGDTEYGYVQMDAGTLKIGVDATGTGSTVKPVSFYTDSSFGFKATGGSTRFNISSSDVTTYLNFKPNTDGTKNSGSITNYWARTFSNAVFNNIETITAASDSLVTTDTTMLCDCTSNDIALTIPTSSSDYSGNRYEIKKIDSSANTVTITPTSRTIDGAATATITTQYESITIVSDGTNWFIVD